MLKQSERLTTTQHSGETQQAWLRLLSYALCLGGGVMIGVDFALLPLSRIVVVALIFGVLIGVLGLLLCGLVGWHDVRSRSAASAGAAAKADGDA